MANDKAALYKRSNPHRSPAPTEGNYGQVKSFQCYIGSRLVMVRAASVSEAINKAQHQCSSRELVTEIKLNGRMVWNCHDYTQ